MQGAFLYDIVISKCPSVLELPSSKNQSLLIGRNALFILNFDFTIFNRFFLTHMQSDALARENPHKDYHTF